MMLKKSWMSIYPECRGGRVASDDLQSGDEGERAALSGFLRESGYCRLPRVHRLLALQGGDVMDIQSRFWSVWHQITPCPEYHFRYIEGLIKSEGWSG